MQHTIGVTINGPSAPQSEILVALLSEAGYEAFEETDQALKAFIPAHQFDPEALQGLLQSFELTFDTELLAPRNWNEEWEQQYQPVVVDDFAGVRAHFHPPLTGVQHEIIITPKMSFGTGHHATTWQMMQLMRDMDFAGKRVFDFGSGTGVLAILAEKLGAAGVLAVDIEDWCIENAAENAERNQCTCIEVKLADTPPAGRQFDCILANINRHILLEYMESMSTALATGGVLLVSGFYEAENELLIGAAARQGLQVKAVSERNNWSCIQFVKPVSS
jgi:ribosomal protein L11 methyltransferase